METYKSYTFKVILAPDDDPESYAPGLPTVTAYEANEAKAREWAEDFGLEPGEQLGELIEEEE